MSAVFSGLVVSVVSVAWPKFTGTPRPEALEKVHEIVKDTIIGKKTAQVLGVSYEKKTEPIDAGKLVNNLKDWAGQKIQDRASEIVTKQAVTQINQGFGKLSSREQEILREAICKPASDSASN